MFNSISVATPNSTVTSSFVADETCTIDVGSNYTVRVNGTVTSTRPINLVTGNTIQIDVVAPAAKEHVFVQYTYNEQPAYFAVVSNSGETKVKLKTQYLNFIPSDVNRTANSGYHQMVKPDGQETALNSSSGSNTQLTQDVVVFFEGPFFTGTNKPINTYQASDGTQINNGYSTVGAVDGTIVWNNNVQNWEQYWIQDNGCVIKIGRDYTKTVGTLAMPGAKCIFSDSVSTFVGGVNFLHILSDINTIGKTYTLVEETVYGGEAIGANFLITTNKGNAYKSGVSGLELLFNAGMIGRPAKFKNHYIVPVPTEWAVRIYDADFNLVDTIDTGDRVPMYARSSKTAFVISFASSNDVALFTALDATPVYRTFSRKSSFAAPGDVNVFSSSRFDDYQMVIPANPPVSGVSMTAKQPPAEVDVGSGEFTIQTDGEDLPIYTSPNAQLLLEGVKTETGLANNDTKFSIYSRSTNHRSNAVVVIGYTAFDFKTQSVPGEYLSRYVDIPHQFLAPTVTFNVTVPEEVVDSPIAISHGTLTVNGTPHDGVSRVDAGDLLSITMKVPNGATRYYGMLSFADAQYALVVNTAGEVLKDSQYYRDFGDLETYSTITVDETGSYDFPNYSNAKVFKDDIELVFPTDLTEGDEIEIRHVRASGVYYDKRDTILMGVSSNYLVQSVSFVDDVPDEMDFGFVHNGIPDFEYDGDLFPVVSGLTDGFSIKMYADRMTFSVNGGPFEATPSITNGDVVQARYNVKNFFETQYAKTLLVDGKTVVEFGYLNIDPTLGQFMPPLSEEHDVDTDWKKVWEKPVALQIRNNALTVVTQKEANAPYGEYTRPRIGTTSASIPIAVTDGRLGSKASTAKYNTSSVPTSKAERLPAITNIRQLSGSVMFASALTDGRTISTTKNVPELSGISSITNTNRLQTFRSIETQTKSKKGLFDNQRALSNINGYNPGYKLMNLDKTDTQVTLYHSHETAFGKPASYQIFIPVFDYEASVLPSRVTPFYSYLNDPADRDYGPDWTFVNSEVGRNSQDMVFLKPISSNNIGVGNGWIRTFKHVEYTDVFPKSEPTASVAAVYSPSVVYASATTSVRNLDKAKATAQTDIPVVLKAKMTAELYSANENLTTSGGFATEEAAEAAAALYSTKNPYEVYQQPEGTFSFVVKRDTGLVCEVKNAGFTVVAWLIGGG